MKRKTIKAINAYLSGMRAKENGEFKSSNPHRLIQVGLHSQWGYGWDHGKVTVK